jgi:glycosyltransferase involved in cell wall biosynthesis
MTKISIIVPVYYSAKFIHKLIYAIDEVKNKNAWDLELVLVDDGSKDGSFDVIKELYKDFKYIKAVKLSRNFGHQAAVKTGLSIVSGDYIAIIDDDLQDPPSLLPQFFSYLDQGFDVAYGVRKKRKESFFKKTSYYLFYRILDKISNINVQLDSGDFCVMKKNVVDSMLLLNEKNPFLRGIRSWVGFKQIGVEYERQGRIEGDSGYTLKKLLKIALDGIFSYSYIPIRFISFIGFTGLLFAIIFSFITLAKYYMGSIEAKGYTSLILVISYFCSSMLISIGIIGEYIIRIFDEVRNRPISIIEQKLNID